LKTKIKVLDDPQHSKMSVVAVENDNNNNKIKNSNHIKHQNNDATTSKLPRDLLQQYKTLRYSAVTQESCPPSLLQSTYGPNVTCHFTVVRMDPRADSKRFWSLESVAYYNPESCIVFLTTACGSEQQTRNRIYSYALPHLKQMIHNGRVRIGFLDRHQPPRYQSFIDTCRSVNNPTAVLMHHLFWKDEFTPQDSDTVLIVQDDSAMCRPFDYSNNHSSSWAYAGAPWPPHASRILPYPVEGKCMEVQNKFQAIRKSFKRQWRYLSQKNTKNNHQNGTDAVDVDLFPPPRASMPSQLSKDNLQVLQNCTQFIVGNGGYSLRSRQWMNRVTQVCPNRRTSAELLNNNDPSPPHYHYCSTDEPNEDVYFVTILYGMEAPMPTPYQAAEFAVEAHFLEDLWTGRFNTDAAYLDGTPSATLTPLPPSTPNDKSSPQQQQQHQIQVQGQTWTIPGAFHKPWWYIPKSIILSPEMEEACPFLQFIFTPNDAKY
jgi:Protein of unknown function (DUF5672)